MVVRVAFPLTGIVCIGVVVCGGEGGGGVELFEAKVVCAADEVWGGGAEELAELIDDWVINEVWGAVELFKTMVVGAIADDVWAGADEIAELVDDWANEVWGAVELFKTMVVGTTVVVGGAEELAGDWVLSDVWGEELTVVGDSIVDWALAQPINANCIIV